MIQKYKLLQLFEVNNENELNYSDRLLFNDILRRPQSGGGISIRPDLGEIAGMVERTGYVDRYPPVFVDELLSGVAFQTHNQPMNGGKQTPSNMYEQNRFESSAIPSKLVTAKDFPVLYVNLEKDVSKKEILEENLKKNGFRFERIDAIYGKKLGDKSYRAKVSKLLDIPDDKLEPSFWMDRKNFKTMCSYEDVVLAKVGCYLSHILAIKTALDNNYENVLILEDDSFPLSNINTPFRIPDDADMYYLGGGFMHQVKPNLKDSKSEHILLDTSKLKLCCTFAYILPSREKMETMYRLFMSVFNDSSDGISDEKSHDIHEDWRTGEPKMRAQSCDFMYINFFQKFGTSYVINPVLFTHKEMGSNIVNNRKRYDLSFFYHPSQKKMLEPNSD
jgi:hypothetical protein